MVLYKETIIGIIIVIGLLASIVGYGLPKRSVEQPMEQPEEVKEPQTIKGYLAKYH